MLLTLSQVLPYFAGDVPLTGYVLEKRDSTKKTWQAAARCGAAGDSMSCRVSGLSLGTSYFFRAFAENECGLSAPTETDVPLVTRKKCEPPSQLLPAIVKDVHKDSCKLSWQPPVSDGGAPLIGYHVEKRTNGGRWIRVTGNECVREPSLLVRDLLADSEIEFRVAAENQAGLLGEFSEPSRPVTAKEPFGEFSVKHYS